MLLECGGRRTVHGPDAGASTQPCHLSRKLNPVCDVTRHALGLFGGPDIEDIVVGTPKCKVLEYFAPCSR
jgi:hypothetical protein